MSKRAGSFEQSNIFLRRGIAPESSTITLLQQANKVKGDQLFDFEKLWLYQQYHIAAIQNDTVATISISILSSWPGSWYERT